MISGSNSIGESGILRDTEGRWISRFVSLFGAGDAFMEKLRALYVRLEHVWGAWIS